MPRRITLWSRLLDSESPQFVACSQPCIRVVEEARDFRTVRLLEGSQSHLPVARDFRGKRSSLLAGFVAVPENLRTMHNGYVWQPTASRRKKYASLLGPILARLRCTPTIEG